MKMDLLSRGVVAKSLNSLGLASFALAYARVMNFTGVPDVRALG
jgi:hypothetical protein